jgi:predicted DNA-binding WGR domain protein
MMQLDMFPTQIQLQCIDLAKNKRRFYAMQIQPTLFGEWELVREWGRIGRAGRVRHDAYPSAGLAFDALSELRRQKGRRGYRPRF